MTILALLFAPHAALLAPVGVPPSYAAQAPPLPSAVGAIIAACARVGVDDPSLSRAARGVSEPAWPSLMPHACARAERTAMRAATVAVTDCVPASAWPSVVALSVGASGVVPSPAPMDGFGAYDDDDDAGGGSLAAGEIGIETSALVAECSVWTGRSVHDDDLHPFSDRGNRSTSATGRVLSSQTDAPITPQLHPAADAIVVRPHVVALRAASPSRTYLGVTTWGGPTAAVFESAPMAAGSIFAYRVGGRALLLSPGHEDTVGSAAHDHGLGNYAKVVLPSAHNTFTAHRLRAPLRSEAVGGAGLDGTPLDRFPYSSARDLFEIDTRGYRASGTDAGAAAGDTLGGEEPSVWNVAFISTASAPPADAADPSSPMRDITSFSVGCVNGLDVETDVVVQSVYAVGECGGVFTDSGPAPTTTVHSDDECSSVPRHLRALPHLLIDNFTCAAAPWPGTNFIVDPRSCSGRLLAIHCQSDTASWATRPPPPQPRVPTPTPVPPPNGTVESGFFIPPPTRPVPYTAVVDSSKCTHIAVVWALRWPLPASPCPCLPRGAVAAPTCTCVKGPLAIAQNTPVFMSWRRDVRSAIDALRGGAVGAHAANATASNDTLAAGWGDGAAQHGSRSTAHSARSSRGTTAAATHVASIDESGPYAVLDAFTLPSVPAWVPSAVDVRVSYVVTDDEPVIVWPPPDAPRPVRPLADPHSLTQRAPPPTHSAPPGVPPLPPFVPRVPNPVAPRAPAGRNLPIVPTVPQTPRVPRIPSPNPPRPPLLPQAPAPAPPASTVADVTLVTVKSFAGTPGATWTRATVAFRTGVVVVVDGIEATPSTVGMAVGPHWRIPPVAVADTSHLNTAVPYASYYVFAEEVWAELGRGPTGFETVSDADFADLMRGARAADAGYDAQSADRQTSDAPSSPPPRPPPAHHTPTPVPPRPHDMSVLALLVRVDADAVSSSLYSAGADSGTLGSYLDYSEVGFLQWWARAAHRAFAALISPVIAMWSSHRHALSGDVPNPSQRRVCAGTTERSSSTPTPRVSAYSLHCAQQIVPADVGRWLTFTTVFVPYEVDSSAAVDLANGVLIAKSSNQSYITIETIAEIPATSKANIVVPRRSKVVVDLAAHRVTLESLAPMVATPPLVAVVTLVALGTLVCLGVAFAAATRTGPFGPHSDSVWKAASSSARGERVSLLAGANEVNDGTASDYD